jgi:hypothetical protein
VCTLCWVFFSGEGNINKKEKKEEEKEEGRREKRKKRGKNGEKKKNGKRGQMGKGLEKRNQHRCDKKTIAHCILVRSEEREAKQKNQ